MSVNEQDFTDIWHTAVEIFNNATDLREEINIEELRELSANIMSISGKHVEQDRVEV